MEESGKTLSWETLPNIPTAPATSAIAPLLGVDFLCDVRGLGLAISANKQQTSEADIMS